MNGRTPTARRPLRPTVILVWCGAGLVLGLLGWIVVDIFVRGVSQLSIDFLTHEPEDAGRGGGIGTIIVSTMMILFISMVVAVPIALASAVMLSEQMRANRLSMRLIRRSLDVLAAVPSIVFGLFGNAFFCVLLGMGYSILAGGLTLACMVLPILIRTAEQALRAVPDDYRRGAAALGLSRTTTLFRIVIPTAAPALGAGFVLGVGRAIAETAALLFTAGYVSRMPESVFDSGRSLSVHIYDLAMNVPNGNNRAYATALVLIALLLLINTCAVALTRLASRHVSGASEAGGIT